MALRVEDITEKIRHEIEAFDAPVEVVDVGYVLEVGDGIARLSGLADVMAGELLEFPGGVLGIALNLEADNVGVVIMGEYTEIEEGDIVRSTGRIASVPVGDSLTGRVVNALGEPIDGKGPIRSDSYRSIEHIAPGVVYRQNVDTPVQTGIKASTR